MSSPIPITEVSRLAHDGRGIAKVEGKTVFITGALPEEQVSFRYTYRKSQFDQAQVIDILRASPDRIEPGCPHAAICGGCCLQHINSQAQVHHKEALLLEQLLHFGKVEPPSLSPALRGKVWGYRRKARLSVRYVHKKGRMLVGFHEKDARYVADLSACKVLDPIIGECFAELAELLGQLSIYRAIPQLEMAVGDHAVVLVLRHLEPLSDSDKEKLTAFGLQHRIVWYLQPGNASTVAPLNEPVTLSYDLPAYQLSLEFLPLDFIQVNREVNQMMVQQAMEWLDVNTHDHVLDLFCGIGNFSLPLARLSASVTGVEGDIAMVKRAQHNAQRNQITNAEFFTADLSQPVSAMPWFKKNYNKLLLDPARAGALEIVQQIQSWGVSHILYVSCNPATLARDAGELVKQGYELVRLGVLDMFPHTHHVEAMALFVKAK